MSQIFQYPILFFTTKFENLKKPKTSESFTKTASCGKVSERFGKQPMKSYIHKTTSKNTLLWERVLRSRSKIWMKTSLAVVGLFLHTIPELFSVSTFCDFFVSFWSSNW